jgi:transcriptional regulator with XRE-family HTH domain
MANKKRITTSNMLSRILKTNNIVSLIKNNDNNMETRTFAGYLQDLCKEKGVVQEHIILRSDIERTYGHQIFRGLHAPSRDKVIQLAFGFGLNVEETQTLLCRSRHSALYPKLKRDAVIIFCLNKQKTILEAQELLYELELTILGGKQNAQN